MVQFFPVYRWRKSRICANYYPRGVDNLDMLTCCTGIGLLVQEQKVAETVLAHLVILEIHLHGVVPVYLPLEVFLWGGFWNGFLLGPTCEAPATAKGRRF